MKELKLFKEITSTLQKELYQQHKTTRISDGEKKIDKREYNVKICHYYIFI